MNEDRRWSENPTPEAHGGTASAARDAYGRATNRARFAVLHTFAVELLDSLEREFEVQRTERYGLDSELERDAAVLRPTVNLVPRERTAAGITVAFSGFPGLRVRFGRWCTMAFPSCGCDACNETAEGETARLKSFIDDVIEGRFREAIEMSAAEDAWVEWECRSARGRSRSRSRLEPSHARQLLEESGHSSYAWKPWRSVRSPSP